MEGGIERKTVGGIPTCSLIRRKKISSERLQQPASSFPHSFIIIIRPFGTWTEEFLKNHAELSIALCGRALTVQSSLLFFLAGDDANLRNGVRGKILHDLHEVHLRQASGTLQHQRHRAGWLGSIVILADFLQEIEDVFPRTNLSFQRKGLCPCTSVRSGRSRRGPPRKRPQPRP